MKKYEKLLLPVSIIIAAIVISIGLSNFNHKKPTKQIQIESEKKKEKVEDVMLACDDGIDVISIVFNDKTKSFKRDGNSVVVTKWNDSVIEYNYAGMSHRLDRLTGYHNGYSFCSTTYKTF